jgi:preprotein translocase subunit SecG
MMEIVRIIANVLLILFDLFLIAVVLLQPGKTAGLSGSIAGGAETFFGKNKAKSFEGKLAFYTKVAAVGFIILSIVLVFAQNA